MNAAQLERLAEHLQRLRLFKRRERLEARLQEASAQELSSTDFRETGLSEEGASQTAKNLALRTALARFPFRWTRNRSSSLPPATPSWRSGWGSRRSSMAIGCCLPPPPPSSARSPRR